MQTQLSVTMLTSRLPPSNENLSALISSRPRENVLNSTVHTGVPVGVQTRYILEPLFLYAN